MADELPLGQHVQPYQSSRLFPLGSEEKRLETVLNISL